MFRVFVLRLKPLERTRMEYNFPLRNGLIILDVLGSLRKYKFVIVT